MFKFSTTAYPDGHTETSDSEEQQIQYLKDKVDAGADFIVTQLFYDVDGFLQWQRNVRDAGERDTSSPKQLFTVLQVSLSRSCLVSCLFRATRLLCASPSSVAPASLHD
jgi:hypothetical protein